MLQVINGHLLKKEKSKFTFGDLGPTGLISRQSMKPFLIYSIDDWLKLRSGQIVVFCF